MFILVAWIHCFVYISNDVVTRGYPFGVHNFRFGEHGTTGCKGLDSEGKIAKLSKYIEYFPKTGMDYLCHGILGGNHVGLGSFGAVIFFFFDFFIKVAYIGEPVFMQVHYGLCITSKYSSIFLLNNKSMV